MSSTRRWNRSLLSSFGVCSAINGRRRNKAETVATRGQWLKGGWKDRDKKFWRFRVREECGM